MAKRKTGKKQGWQATVSPGTREALQVRWLIKGGPAKGAVKNHNGFDRVVGIFQGRFGADLPDTTGVPYPHERRYA
jgi:hypothetical protein